MSLSTAKEKWSHTEYQFIYKQLALVIGMISSDILAEVNEFAYTTCSLNIIV